MDVLADCSGSIQWYKNNGDQTFTQHATGIAGTFLGLLAADLDGDTDLDIIGSTSTGYFYWYQNDGSQNFSQHHVAGRYINCEEIASADLDGDGDIDVFAASTSVEGGGDGVAWYENDGAGNFTTHTIDGKVYTNRDIFIADMDGDGDLDVLSDAWNQGHVFWYENGLPEMDVQGNGQSIADGDNSPDTADGTDFGSLDYGTSSSNTFTIYNTDDGEGTLILPDTPMVSINGPQASYFTVDPQPDEGHLAIGESTTFTVTFSPDSSGPFTATLSIDNCDCDENPYNFAIRGAGSTDFGDAPLPYPTLLADNGANHGCTGPKLGSLRDQEPDGPPAADANGDDNDGIDDEDGVSNWQNLQVGKLDASVTVNVQDGPAKLDVWIDWNRDGCWGGPADRAIENLTVNTGDNTVTFDVPSWAHSGLTFARFRLSTDGVIGPAGNAADGEVEDYQVSIAPPTEKRAYFSMGTTIDPDFLATDVLTADMDRDGDMDILASNGDNPTIIWYENNGTGFTKNTISTGVGKPYKILPRDIEGDGDMDIVFADTYYLINIDGTQVFDVRSAGNGPTIHSFCSPDFDGDGDMDILGAETWFSNFFFMEFNSNEEYVDYTRLPKVEGLNENVSAIDIDRDGDMDVLAAGENDIFWMENDGTGNALAHNIPSTLLDFRDVCGADLDGDGDMDVIAASGSNNTIAWYQNNGGSFTETIITTSLDGVRDIFVTDLDGDGDMDVLSASAYDAKIAWQENDGNQNFTEQIISYNAIGASTVIAADIDGDGDLDVLSASTTADNRITLYEQIPHPIVTTAFVTNITTSSADCGGLVIDVGQPAVSIRGVCWNTGGNPTLADNHTSDGTGFGSFTSAITGLMAEQIYYVRAYATNSEGTIYGDQKIFITRITSPGNALDFDGTDDYVTVPYDYSLYLGNYYTIEAWVKPTDLSGRYSIFSSRINDDNGQIQLEVGTGASGTSRVALTGKGTWIVQTEDNVINPGEWTHIACTMSGTSAGTGAIYVNGISQPLISNAAYTCYLAAVPRLIGGGTSGLQNFPGQIDEVRIWKGARTEAAIRENMNKILNGDEPNLVAYYRFDHSSGTSLLDGTNNANHGTLVNMIDNDWVTSAASFGDESQVGTGSSNLTETTEVSVDITWDGDDPGTGAIFAAIQVHGEPDVSTGLNTNYPATYWELWLADEDASFNADVTFHYDDIDYISDESALELYTRSEPGQSWTQVTGMTIDDEGNGTDGVGSVTANNLTGWSQFILSSSVGLCEAPVITHHPQTEAICVSENYTFTVASTGSALSYQWKKDGSDISGAHSTFYSIDPVAPGDAGAYTCFISNNCGNTTSNPGTLTVMAEIVITTQPDGASKCVGESVTFTVVASGYAPTYQWQKNESDISGATTSSFSIASMTSNAAGNYSCIVSNDCGSESSDTAVLEFLEAVSFVTHPITQMLCPGEDVVFSVSVTGSGPFTYQWFKDSFEISEETSDALTLSNLTVAEQGEYTCEVTGACTPELSNVAVLTVDGDLVAYAFPGSQPLGLVSPVFDVDIECAIPNILTVWEASPPTALIPIGTSVTLDPPPAETTLLEVTVTDEATRETVTDQAWLLVAVNPGYHDYNTDGCNNLQDLWDLIQYWREPYPSDANDDGIIDVCDFLYISLVDPTPCP